MILRVTIGAAKLMNCICIKAKTPIPGNPKNANTGASLVAIAPSNPLFSSTLIKAIITTSTGSNIYKAKLSAVSPDFIIISTYICNFHSYLILSKYLKR